METLTLTTTKIITNVFNLKPFGRFSFSWTKPRNKRFYKIYISELAIYYDTSRPLTKEQEVYLIKFMKDNKTDVLIDNDMFYTRTNNGITQISHENFDIYYQYLNYNNLKDSPETWNNYKQKLSYN
jgi:hypothetical protein